MVNESMHEDSHDGVLSMWRHGKAGATPLTALCHSHGIAPLDYCPSSRIRSYDYEISKSIDVKSDCSAMLLFESYAMPP